MMDAPAEMQIQRLVHERDQLLREAEALKNKIAGLDMAIGLIGNGPMKQPGSSPGRKVHVSETIVTLLREAGEAGLKARTTIELAAERGIYLNGRSVYSLLSKMTRDGTVVHEDGRYRLKEFGRYRASIVGVPEPMHTVGDP